MLKKELFCQKQRWMDRWADGWIDRQTDRWKNILAGGRMNGQINELMDR
jgi:hypothetical protein